MGGIVAYRYGPPGTVITQLKADLVNWVFRGLAGMFFRVAPC